MGVASRDLVAFFSASGATVVGDWSGVIERPAALNGHHDTPVFTYCERGALGAEDAVAESDAKLLIVHQSVLERLRATSRDRILVGCDAPRLTFIRAIDRFWPEMPGSEQADGPSIIHESARVADDARVYAGVMIGPGCVVGPECALHSGVKLYRGTTIGSKVRIDSNAVIGSPGFGFARDPSGRWIRFPQMAAVTIEDDVEIGAGTCIDRGALSDTVIGRGTRIDNLAYIAHNVVVGQNCLIMASSIVAGSCRIENGAVISPGANIRNGVCIGQAAHVGMGAVVLRDVDPRTVVVGVPARNVRKGTYEG